LSIHKEKEKSMKKLLSVMIMVGVWSFLPSIAAAVCDRPSAQVVRVSATPGAAASTIYYRDNALSSFHWACTTNDAKLLDAALTAQNGLTRAYIRGDAASCPAAPATGQVSAGSCLLVIVNP
jgi:hypothetical protein